MESSRLSVALDAPKCRKSEIMDIFLEIAAGKAATAPRLRAGPARVLDNETLSDQWFMQKP